MKKQKNIVISIVLSIFVLNSPLAVHAFESQEVDKMQPSMLPHSPFAYIIREHYYGEMLSWKDVRPLLPRKAKFQVIDLETGISFQVQKRAGNQHADVQPLTRNDTQIMKEIYEDKWSWKRRAILVNIDDRFIAASMHGMPHGGGALSNGFPGHFCIHFAGSMTHRTKNTDPTHQLMVLKAAGKLEEYRDQMDPYEVADLFLTAINQSDLYLLQITLAQPYREHAATILERFNQIGVAAKDSPYKKIDQLPVIALELPVELQYHDPRQGKKRKSVTLTLIRDGLTNRWEIYSKEFFDLK
ncbi:hypothetical protein SAMN05216352_101430 [Alteribacillus bidgolensis]|uniref:Uncharacterized protein n=2 Tax=Alteribacillus bidgolensis TaxID=930129 RepID=A0A1G8CT98_9BACI|nr:hypothetical protein SAMN05216352_101430 [Alteribacillus bidgolensis]